MSEDFHFLFFWTLEHQYWNSELSFAWVTTFCLNLFWPGVSFYRQNWGTKQKWPHHLSFWDRQLARGADLIKFSQKMLNWLHWLAGYLKKTNDCAISALFPLLAYERRSQSKNYQEALKLVLLSVIIPTHCIV